MFTTLSVKHFGCVENVEVALTPLHAFIGPNDSGKSTLLRAVEWGCYPHGLQGKPDRRRVEFAAPVQATKGSIVSLGFPDRGKVNTVKTASGEVQAQDSGGRFVAMPLLLRLDPDALRSPSPEIPQGQPIAFVNARGAGLAAAYDALQSREFEAFLAIRERVMQLFPSVQHIGFPGAQGSTGQRTVTVTLKDKTQVPVQALSEGLLYFLALAILPHIDAGSVVLLEEPENGLHPARIVDVMRVLREVSKTTQVLIATHSPLVINELQPDEVSVVTRGESGSVVTPIAKTHNFDERAETFALGELWLAYANGSDEASLISGAPVL